MWYPIADKKPVTRYAKGGSIHIPMRHVGRVCLHTAVSSGNSLFSLFNTPGNPVAHFYLRKDGSLEQYVGTGVRASANLDGNYDMIAIESWDNGGQRETFTDDQMSGVSLLLVWLHNRHSIPMLALPDSKPGRKGVGWHRLGIDGNFPPGLLSGRVSGGEHWSESTGKECPFDGKIKQIHDEILPNVRKIIRERNK